MIGEHFNFDKSAVPLSISSENEVKLSSPINRFNGSMVKADPCAGGYSFQHNVSRFALDLRSFLKINPLWFLMAFYLIELSSGMSIVCDDDSSSFLVR